MVDHFKMQQIDGVTVAIGLQSVEVVVVDAGYNLRGFGLDGDGDQNGLLALVKVELDGTSAGADVPAFGGNP